MKSKLFTINTRDLINGLIIAFLTAIISGVIEILSRQDQVFAWITVKPILIAGASAALSYLLKNFATNSRNYLMTREPMEG